MKHRNADRLSRLEKAITPECTSFSPVLLVRAGETEERAAARQGIDLSDPDLLKVLFVLPDNGRDRR